MLKFNPEEERALEKMELEKRNLLCQQLELLAEKAKSCTDLNELCQLSYAIVEVYKADRIIF